VNEYRADRVVRTLTFVVSVVYFAAWATAALLLIGMPAARLLAAKGVGHASFSVDVTIPELPATVASTWASGASGIHLTDVAGALQLPVAAAPTWFIVASWFAFAVTSALMVSFLYHLRRLFLRVRDGAPFDIQNATRLRWLGALLLALALFKSAFTFWTSAVVTRAISSSSVPLAPALNIDWLVVFVALVLLALAEIFRRGAALEDEQALVV
jgi:hypothetical protein